MILYMKTQPYHVVRTSKIHGRGVFAARPIRKDIRVLEYTGPIISEKEADEVGISTDKDGHSHTMLFQVSKKRVINGNEGGDARYVNHGCDPNCETEQDGDQIFIKSLRAIKKGEEERKEMSKFVREEMEEFRKDWSVVSRTEFEALEARVKELEQKLQ